MMNKEKIISLSLVGAIGLSSCMPAMAMQASDVPIGGSGFGSSQSSKLTAMEVEAGAGAEADEVEDNNKEVLKRYTSEQLEKIFEDAHRQINRIRKVIYDRCCKESVCKLRAAAYAKIKEDKENENYTKTRDDLDATGAEVYLKYEEAYRHLAELEKKANEEAVKKAKEEAEEAVKKVNAIADQVAHKELDEKLKKEDKVLENLHYKTAKISNKIKVIREKELELKIDKTRYILSKKEEIQKKEINQKWEEMREERDEEFKRNQDEIEKSSKEEHKKIDEDLKKTPEEKRKAHYETYEKIEAQLCTLREETDKKFKEINEARQAELEALEEAKLRILHEVEDTRLEIEKDLTEKYDKVVKAFEEVERTFKEEPEKKLEAIENFEKVFAEVEKEMNARIQKIQEIKGALKEIESLIKKFMAYIKLRQLDYELCCAYYNMFRNRFYESYKEFNNKLKTQPEVYEFIYRLFGPELKKAEELLKPKCKLRSTSIVPYPKFELAFAEFAELFMEYFEETESNNVFFEITHQEYNKQSINEIKSQLKTSVESFNRFLKRIIK